MRIYGSCYFNLENQRHLSVWDTCAFCESCLLDLEKQRYFSQRASCTFFHSHNTMKFISGG